jgi:hypothetical protein
MPEPPAPGPKAAASEDVLVQVFVNPHVFHEVDEPWASTTKRPLTNEAALSFLCTPGLASDPESLAARYREISFDKPRLFAAPTDIRILDKLVWPLRHAKSGYMLGNYLGTIALSGMVAEMVAVLFFDLAELALDDKPMTAEVQKQVFGRPFESLGQERRVEILAAYSIITPSLRQEFDKVRLIRRKYLHLLSQDHVSLPTDAIETFQAAVSLTVAVIGQDLYKGKLILKPAMLRYLKKKGSVQPKKEE